MKKDKLSLENIKGILSRYEMKKIMAGSGNFISECINGQTVWYLCGSGPNCYVTSVQNGCYA